MTDSTDNNVQFEHLRDEIDHLDKELVNLIAKRLKVTKAIGEIKSNLDLALYHPEREAKLIANKRQFAEQLGVSADLIEDVIRRIIRDSYKSQTTQKINTSSDEQKNILVIGGRGQLGRLFVDLFLNNGDKVSVIEKNDSLASEPSVKKLSEADLVLVTVPINLTSSIIDEISRCLTQVNPQCILADLTSIKERPLSKMLSQHQGAVLGLHPMFGPDIETFAKQTIAVCHGRFQEQYQWLLDLLSKKGINLVEIEAKEHDQLMSIIQVLRHISTVAYGNHLRNENICLEKILDLSSPIYRLELIMVGRLFAQDPVLYSDIIFSDKENIDMIQKFIQSLQDTLELVKLDDKDNFIKTFKKTKSWFGQYAQQFSVESNHLLAKASDG